MLNNLWLNFVGLFHNNVYEDISSNMIIMKQKVLYVSSCFLWTWSVSCAPTCVCIISWRHSSAFVEQVHWKVKRVIFVWYDMYQSCL